MCVCVCVCVCVRACVRACVCVCEEGSERKVRREVRGDKEEWMDETIQGMEEDMRSHRQGDFIKKELQQQQSDTSRHHTR